MGAAHAVGPIPARIPAYRGRRTAGQSGWSPEPFFNIAREDRWPKIDAYAEKGDMVARVEAPVIRPEDTGVFLEEVSLKVRGRSEREEKVDERDYYRMKRSYASFMRSLRPLPGTGESDVRARYCDDVLEARVAGAGRVPAAVKKVVPVEAKGTKPKKAPAGKPGAKKK